MSQSSTSRPIASRSIGHPDAPVACVAILAGFSMVVLCVALTECAYRSMDISPLTFQLSVAAAMFATALGPICLAQVLLSFRKISLRRGQSDQDTHTQNVKPSKKRAEDRELRWMVTSVVALGGCVLILVTPEIFQWVHRAKAIVVREFLWASLSVSALESVVLFIIAVAPFSFLGLLVRCAHQVSNCDGRWNPTIGAWFLSGAALALFVVPWLVGRIENHFLLMRLACGPMVIAALISTWQVTRKQSLPRHQEADNLTEPEFGQRWPTVLRLAVAVLTVAVVCACVVWVYVAGAVRYDRDVSFAACGGLLLSAASGLYLASRRARDANDLVGVFGQSAVGAGIVLAGAVAVFNLVLRECDAPFVYSFGFALLWVICSCGPIFFAAYAIGIGSISILRRFAYRGQHGATLLWMRFAVVGLTILFVAPEMVRRLGSFATLAATALCMVATGGILIIHGPASRQGIQRVRIAGVFAVVLLMMWTMPYLGRGWLSVQQHPRQLVAESTWMSFCCDRSGSLRAIHATDSDSTMGQNRFGLRSPDEVREPRVAVLDLDGTSLELLPPNLSTHADTYSFDLQLRKRIGGSKSSSYATVKSWPEFRSAADHYDLLIVSLSDLPPKALRKTISHSFFETTIARLSGDGVLMLLVPMDDSESLNRVGRLAVSYESKQFYCGVTGAEAQGREMVSVFLACGLEAESKVRSISPYRLHSPQVLTRIRPNLTVHLSDASAARDVAGKLASVE